jgi:2-oxo-3-hexenedioate decarboxylase
MNTFAELAQSLDNAASTATPIPPLSATRLNLSIRDAYDIQAHSIANRVERRDKRCGIKVALSSRADMRRAGISNVIVGRLTRAMEIPDGSSIPLNRYIKPQVEAELAYLIGRPLSGIVSATEVRLAIEAVAPALEIIDSRYSVADVASTDMIADNAFCGGYLLGRFASADTDVRNLGVLLDVNGRNVQIGSTAAILGDPLRSLCAAACLVLESGGTLDPGDVVLTGNVAPPQLLGVGDYVRSTTENLGFVTFHVT